MSWTDPDDVTDAWIGDDAPDDAEKIQTWIDKAEREIKYRVPDIQTRIDAEAALTPPRTDLLETAKDVVVAMVTRVFRNPEGISQRTTTESTGPFSNTDYVSYAGRSLPVGLGLTEDELAKLQAKQQGAFTISLIPSTSPFYVAP